MKKIISVFFICIIVCFNLSSCDCTTYPKAGHYVCEEPFFELYYNVDHDTPGNCKLEYKEIMVDADFSSRGNTGVVVSVEDNSSDDGETLYAIKWKLDSEGNIILDRYNSSNEYYDTITLEKQE